MGAEKVCIIEDSVELVDVLTNFLEDNNYQVVSFNSAEDFFEKREDSFRGLYLVDWHLPGEPGINIITKIRKDDKISPIFMLSAFSKNQDIVTGLKAGADDYITKPFDFDQLIIKIDNAHKKYSHIKDEINVEGIKLLDEASAFLKDGVTVNLTIREYKIFKKLFENFTQPVTREDLINCFRTEDNMTLRNIDVHIFSLRRKIKDVNFIIETVRGIGYKLI